MKKLIRVFVPFATGVLFAVGLGVSGMTEPSKVIGFLDVFGGWDPSLAFVMVGAVGVSAVFYRLSFRCSAPWCEERFFLPTKKSLDFSLIFGAVLFGVGWGVSGLCPGPGLASLMTGKGYGFVFVVSMIAGMVVAKVYQAKGPFARPALSKSKGA
ncbi:MAG: hypothetical protein CL675_03550 [Bdellovibrionaceae bacterium]|nr:hypothetical protein [Pseudobdellovibrionaceae bacterium]